MAIQKLTYPSKVWLPIASGCCGPVVLCIKEESLAKLADPTIPFVLAVPDNSGRPLGTAGSARYPEFENRRCEDVFQYSFGVNDTQLDEGAVLTCADIGGISTDSCTIVSLIGMITDLRDQIAELE